MPKGWAEAVGLGQLEAEYLWQGLVEDSRKACSTVGRSFIAFARLQGWSGPYFPVSAKRCASWIAHEAQRTIARGDQLHRNSLGRKLSALASIHTDLGLDCSQLRTKQITRIVRGAQRLHGIVTRKQPKPITRTVLRRMVHAIVSDKRSFGGETTANALCAAFTLAFACFLRMDELTYEAFDEKFNFSIGSVDLHGGTRPSLITIPSSKTDPFRQGATVILPRGPGDIDPVWWIRCHLRGMGRTAAHHPLFSIDGRPFSRTVVIGYMHKALRQAGYQAQEFTGHSFRRGAATWAAAANLPEKDIKTLGRWKSDAFRTYVDAGPASHMDAGRKFMFANAPDTLDADGLPQPGRVWRPAL